MFPALEYAMAQQLLLLQAELLLIHFCGQAGKPRVLLPVYVPELSALLLLTQAVARTLVLLPLRSPLFSLLPFLQLHPVARCVTELQR